jgi:tRNA-2-methylthio-N6-dimethylallyladenosine synthase
MPVQSGSDRMLKRMSRRYRVDEYIERIEALRSAVPGLTLSTDIIVGFPGETEADFAATLDLVQRIGFVGVFGFKYSPRPFTPALKLGDTVAEADKAARLARLFALADGIKRAHLGELVGTHQEVLVEGVGQRGGYTGRTARNDIVHLHADPDPTGEVLEVRVERAFNNSLSATPVANKWLPTTAMPIAAAPLPRLLPIVT